RSAGGCDGRRRSTVTGRPVDVGPLTGSVVAREPGPEAGGPEIERRVVIERLQERLGRGDPEPVGREVVADGGPERRRAHRPGGVVEQVPALDVDVLVVAGARVLVDRQVEPGGGATRCAAQAEDVAGDEVGRRLV